jgi:methionyl-tRNA formyltransferase
LKVYESTFEATNHQEPIGKMMSDNKTFLKVACQDGYIHLLQIQLEGKKRMKVDEFLRGNKVS